ncbi:glycoside hydrolase family 3 domain protein [Gluconacetobacter diazotrophicus PA1 5]|nr:glycoside hydrolase family 3 domain protein [Gluconacetobacter diazotrophicus PA1 5]
MGLTVRTDSRRRRTRLVVAALGVASILPVMQSVSRAGAVDRGTRIASMVARLTPAEKLALVQAEMTPAQGGGPMIVTLPGVPRVGLPALRMALGDGPGLPSPLALMATWDTDLARRAGLAHAHAVRAAGRAIVPMGGVGPVPTGRTRDGEDPLLSGRVMGGAASGLLAGHVLPLFGGKGVAGPGATRADRLLGLYLAMEQARGAGILCRTAIADAHPCGDMDGMRRTIRDGWHFAGMIAELADREVAGDGMARQPFLLATLAAGVDLEGSPATDTLFAVVLRQAVSGGAVQPATLDRMIAHILLPLDQAGVIDRPPPFGALGTVQPPHDPLAEEELAEGAVLLRNENDVLPLATTGGATADGPVLIVGAGAAHDAARALVEALGRTGQAARLAADSPGGGHSPADVARADRIVVFSEGPQDDRLIAAIAGSGGHVVVVLLSDDPDRPMPWLDLVDGVVQAWSWRGGGEAALAALLTGQRDFAGRLPATFTGGQVPAQVSLSGYKAFDRAHVAPLFPFGYGLSVRARFSYSDLRVTRDGTRLVVSFGVTNSGSGAGRDVPQVYLDLPAGVGDAPKRLVGWRVVQLEPGQAARLSLGIDAHLLGQWHPATLEWVVPAGDYALSLGAHSANLVRQAMVHLPELHVPGALPDSESE